MFQRRSARYSRRGTRATRQFCYRGDRFTILVDGNALGLTSAAVNTYPNSIGLNFDAAYADANFSHGDFNVYTSNEPAYGRFLESETDNDGRVYDVQNAPGTWNNGAGFAPIHTQCPCLNNCPVVL